MYRRASKAVALALVLLSALVGAQQSSTSTNIAGTVVSAATQNPIANALVQYEEQGVVRATRTNSAGQFEFEGGGTLGVLIVTVDGFGTTRRAWPPLSGTTVDFALKPPVTIQGTLTDNATLISLDGSVTAVTRGTFNLVSASAVVEGGTFRFDDLPEGPVLVLAHADDRAPSITELTTTAGDWRDVHVRLTADAEVEGRVLDANSQPVVGAHLVAVYDASVAGGGLLAGLVGGSIITDGEGTFTLNGLVPGRPVTIYAIKGGSETDRATVAVNEGTVLDGLVLRLR